MFWSSPLPTTGLLFLLLPCFPCLSVDRIYFSNEGNKMRVTFKNILQNDSNIYLCTNIIKEGNYVMLDGKRTMVVVRAKDNGVVEQSPLSLSVWQGESININCSLKSSHEEEGIFLLKTHMKPEIVMYVSRQNVSTISTAFANRLEYSKQEKTLVIILHNLQKNDSDIYLCVGVLKNSIALSLNGSGTMLLVKDHIKEHPQKRKPNVVYEDMSYSSRRSTLVRANTYSSSN
ncbi:uncharacterized protein ACNFOS_009612 [Eudromia elegans]